MSSLQNKVIWITGASSGIGEALVYECAKQNAKIILSARRESELVRVAKAANLTASNFFISASFHEGMPNAVLESLAVGTPVILSDIPPHEEILVYSEKICGMIFKNCSYLSFKSVLEKIEKMNYQLLSINSNNLIKDKFDASITVKLHEDFFLKLNKNEK